MLTLVLKGKPMIALINGLHFCKAFVGTLYYAGGQTYRGDALRVPSGKRNAG